MTIVTLDVTLSLFVVVSGKIVNRCDDDLGPGGHRMLKAINIIVLAFWFGERAIKNSGLVNLLLERKKE